MLGGGGNPAAWWEVGGERSGHDASGTAAAVAAARAGQRLHRDRDRDHGLRARPTPGGRRSRPISNSEAGFERVYQGSGLLLSWPIALAPGARWSVVRRPTR